MDCPNCKREMDYVSRDEYTIGFSLYYCSYCDEQMNLEDPVCEECGEPLEFCMCP